MLLQLKVNNWLEILVNIINATQIQTLPNSAKQAVVIKQKIMLPPKNKPLKCSVIKIYSRIEKRWFLCNKMIPIYQAWMMKIPV